jgi:hypothetical protein
MGTIVKVMRALLSTTQHKSNPSSKSLTTITKSNSSPLKAKSI